MIANPRSWRLWTFAICLLAASHILYFAYFTRYTFHGHADFTILYTAGKIVNAGHAARLYDPATQWQVQQQIASVPGREGPLLFNHAPYEALLLAPVARLDYRNAYLVWAALNLAMLLVIARLLREYVRPLFPHWSMLVVACIAWFPCTMAFVQGQVSILLLLIYTCVFVALRKKHELVAGLCLAAGIIKPHLVLPCVLGFALQRRWRAVGGFSLGAAALAALSAASMGPSAVIGYGAFLLHFNQLPAEVSAAAPANMPNLRGLIFTLLGALSGTRLALVLTTILSALAVWLASRFRRDDLEFSFAASLIATLLASYHLYVYDVTLLLLPVVLLISMLRSGAIRSSVLERVLTGTLIAFGIAPLVLAMTASQKMHLLSLVLVGVGVSLWMVRARSQERVLAKTVGG